MVSSLSPALHCSWDTAVEHESPLVQIQVGAGNGRVVSNLHNVTVPVHTRSLTMDTSHFLSEVNTEFYITLTAVNAAGENQVLFSLCLFFCFSVCAFFSTFIFQKIKTMILIVICLCYTKNALFCVCFSVLLSLFAHFLAQLFSRKNCVYNALWNHAPMN